MTVNFRLDGKVAIVTGGTGGLGSAGAQALAQAGADLVIAAPDVVERVDVVERLRGHARRVLAVPTDVTDEVSVKAMVQAALAEFGHIDILFNNAGIISSSAFLDLTASDWDSVTDVSAKGTFLCGQAVARHMMEQRYGKIVNMGSIMSTHALPNRSAYCAAKGAVANLTRAMAVELGPFGITVNALAPTAIVTDINRVLVETQPHLYDSVLKRMAIRRLGTPQDIGGALVFLSSPASDFITGHLLHVDGGFDAS